MIVNTSWQKENEYSCPARPAEKHETREKGSCGRGGGREHNFAGTQTNTTQYNNFY